MFSTVEKTGRCALRSLPSAGWFDLIRKGSCQIADLARLVDCGKALNQSELVASIEHHRIPEGMILHREVAKWVIPWKLANIIPLERPVPYEHKSGAVERWFG